MDDLKRQVRLRYHVRCKKTADRLGRDLTDGEEDAVWRGICLELLDELKRGEDGKATNENG